MTGTATAAAGATVRIVVVSHDSGAFLLRGVASVLAQDVPLELVVVDNASSDGSIERLPDDARLRVIRNADNRGFGVACNQGAAGAMTSWLLFLNPDCELPPGALATLIERAGTNAGIGMLGAQLLDSDGTPQAASRRRTPRPAEALRMALGLRSDSGGSSGNADATDASASGRQPDAADAAPFASTAHGPSAAAARNIESVEAISGALMLMPTALFERLGGFDTGYVLHCEDLDLCRRVLDSGARVAIAGDVRVPHHKGTSSRRRPIWVEWQKHRGMLRYFRKFDASASPMWLQVLVPVGIVARFPLAAARAWLAARRARRINASG